MFNRSDRPSSRELSLYDHIKPVFLEDETISLRICQLCHSMPATINLAHYQRVPRNAQLVGPLSQDFQHLLRL